MALSEETVIDQISADEYGNVSVRKRTDIVRDGAPISGASTYHRHVVGPDDDLAKEDARVKAIATVARKDAKPLPKGE